MSSDYSPEAFDEALEEYEKQLGDLYGIETAAQAVLDYAYNTPEENAEQGPRSNYTLTIPASSGSFTVYPMLPIAEEFDYQGWVTNCFEAGQLKAAATKAWLKSIADDYHRVDTQVIIAAAQQQAELTKTTGTQVDWDYAELSGNLSVQWEGDAKEAFFEWFPRAAAVTSVLMHYADAAQVAAGGTADAIAATQEVLLRQAEQARDTATDAVEAWRKDNDVFPFAPGSGFLFSQFGSFIDGQMDKYLGALIKNEALLEVTKTGIKEAAEAVPYAGKAVTAYDFVVAAGAYDTDEKTPEKAEDLADHVEQGIRQIVKKGDAAIDRLTDSVRKLADAVASEPFLSLDRLPREPHGTYTAPS